MTEYTAVHALELAEMADDAYGAEYAWTVRVILWCHLGGLTGGAEYQHLINLSISRQQDERDQAYRDVWYRGLAQAFIRSG